MGLVFRLQIDDHNGQFGSSPESEHGVITRLLSLAAQQIGSHGEVGTEAAPSILTMNGVVVGSYFMGGDSLTEQQQRKKAAAA